MPLTHEPLDDVGILARECFDNLSIGCAEHEECTIGRMAQRTGHDQLAARVRVTHEREVAHAMRHAAIDEVVDGIVRQGEVGHGQSGDVVIW